MIILWKIWAHRYLINNAANNPKMEGKQEKMSIGKFETFPIEEWNKDIEVGLTGTLLCCQILEQ